MACFDAKYAYTVGVVVPARAASSRNDSAARPSSCTNPQAASRMESLADCLRISRHPVEVAFDIDRNSYTVYKLLSRVYRSIAPKHYPVVDLTAQRGVRHAVDTGGVSGD